MSLKLNSSGGGSITLQEPVTTNNQTLTLPDATGTLLSSASTAGFPAGSVVQVVNTVAPAWNYASTSSTYTEMSANLRASITPRSASNSIIYSVSGGRLSYNVAPVSGRVEIRRSTNGGSTWTALHRFVQDIRFDASNFGWIISAQFLDSPATTNTCIYTLFASITGGTSGFESGATTEERTKIILMEVAG